MRGEAKDATGSLCLFCTVAPKRGRLRYVLPTPPPLLMLREPLILPLPLLRAAAVKAAARLLRWGEEKELAVWAGGGRLRMRS